MQSSPGQTIAQKILAAKSGRESVAVGEYVEARIDLAMGHIALGRVIANLMGLPKHMQRVWDPSKIVVIEDHYAPAPNDRIAMVHSLLRRFCKQHGILNYDIKAGICHQVLPEKGHVLPGMLIVGTDSHTTTYGAFNAAGTGIGYTEMSWVFVRGDLWFMVPPSIKIELSGRFRSRVMAKDLMLYLAGRYGADMARYCSLEFWGDSFREISMDSRMCITNMALELGAKFAFTPPDKIMLDWLGARTKKQLQLVIPDEDAQYISQINLDLGELQPMVACPHTVDNVKPASELAGIKIDQAFIGSCTNGRLEDLRIAAQILKGSSIHPDVRLILIPASYEVYRQALREGLIEIFLDAGAVICNPSCGPCFGAHMGLLAPGERCLASINRNFKGRMGSDRAEIYLGSPASVAASAITGEITDPREI